MRYDHFSMLPERAFQPRGPHGMTLEGGGGGIIGDIVGGIGDAISGAVDAVGDVVSGAVDFVKDVGSDIDDFVNEEIPGGWVTVAAVGTGMYLGGAETAALSGATEAATAAELAAAGGGAAELASVGATGYGLTGPIGAAESASLLSSAAVPSAFDTAVNTALGTTPELGSFGSVGTGGFGTALPPAADVSAGLTAAGFAPGTAANLAGQTAAGVGATNLLGGATAAAPLTLPQTLSIQDALRGARLASNLLTPQQQQVPQTNLPAVPQGTVDYSQLLGLLSQRARGTGLLGTQFQPQPINLASLLG